MYITYVESKEQFNLMHIEKVQKGYKKTLYVAFVLLDIHF